MPRNIIRIQKDGTQYMDIQVYNNQKVVRTIKKHEKGLIFDIAANKSAIRNLTPPAFMLYSHFIQNVPDYLEALSRKTIIETTSLTDHTYDVAIKELITKGYLVKSEHVDYEDYYLFYELPSED